LINEKGDMMTQIITPGALLIKSKLPEEVQKHFDASKLLDKNGVKDLMSNVITHGGEKAADTISDLSHLFFNTATEHGYSTPLSDYHNDSDERQALLKEYETAVNHVNNQHDLSERERREHLADLATRYGEILTKQNLQYMLSRKSTAALMAQTGARGNPLQLQQATSSPIQSKRIDGTPIPLAITHSFAEGLTPAEHLAMSYWGRGNTVSAQLSTSKPGDMFKSITPNLYHEVVTVPDCHTHNGVVEPMSEKKRIIFHYEAGTDRLIDERYFNDLKQDGVKQVKVRTVLTCQAKEGVCQKCYGLDSRGKLPEIGENVGVIAAQSASEVLTQMILGTKHDAKAGKSVNPFDQTSNLLTNQEKFPDKAIISDVNGTVSHVETTALGDTKVHVSGKEFFIPNSQDVIVGEGHKVKIGQPLSTGMVNPRELVQLRGIGAGRRYMSNKLSEIYGGGMDPRHFDLVAKNMIKYVKVKDAGDTGYLPGQVLDVNHVQHELDKDTEVLPLERAAGKKLARPVLELTPGTILDHQHVQYLNKHGISEVHTSNSGLIVDPIVPGIKTVKLNDQNWISRLAFKRIGQTLREAAATGMESAATSTDPITPYILGGAFGEGQNGKY
jgi:RNA polymerase Rpb1, domain 5.